MSLPRKGLPSFDDVLADENTQSSLPDFNEDYDESIVDLSDSDFGLESETISTDLPSYDSYKNEEDFSSIENSLEREETTPSNITQDDLSVPEDVFEKGVQDDSNFIEKIKSFIPKSKKKGPNKSKQKKDKAKLDINNIKLNKKQLITIISAFLIILLLIIGFNLIGGAKGKDSKTKVEDAPKTTKVEKSESNSIDNVKYEYKKSMSEGIVYEVTAKKSTKINIQRAFKDEKGNIILCESGDIEVTKGKQEVYAECLNNRENTEIKKSQDTLISDNIVELKNN